MNHTDTAIKSDYAPVGGDDAAPEPEVEAAPEVVEKQEGGRRRRFGGRMPNPFFGAPVARSSGRAPPSPGGSSPRALAPPGESRASRRSWRWGRGGGGAPATSPPKPNASLPPADGEGRGTVFHPLCRSLLPEERALLGPWDFDRFPSVTQEP